MDEANVTELAGLMNVSRQAVYKAERDGRIHRNVNGKFDIEKTISDWQANTHPGHGGKRLPRFPKEIEEREPEVKNHPLVDFWLTLVDHTYPWLAVSLAKEEKIPPGRVWKFLALAFLMEWTALFQLLDIPDEQPIKLEGLSYKLSRKGQRKSLENWLAKEVQKREEEPLDSSIWDIEY